MDELNIFADEQRTNLLVFVKIHTFEKIFNNRDMKKGVTAMIHIFALLHAAVALACRLTGVVDELVLTMLTMIMALLLCLKWERSIEFTASSIIIVNIVGYIFGSLWAHLFSLFISQSIIIHSLSTFITTEMVGWGMVGVLTLFKSKPAESKALSSYYLTWIITAMVIIFFFRLGILSLFSRDLYEPGELIVATRKVFSNSFALIVLICVNIIFIRAFSNKANKLNPWIKLLILCAFILFAILFETLFVKIGLPPVFKNLFDKETGLIAIVAAITEFAVLCIVYIINSAITSRNEMKMERYKANMAQYRYLKLKKQVNPHFLFNSLNVLNYLIIDEKTEQASTYTQKLAAIYRYMLKSEDEDLVTLRDEMKFVEQYIDLIKVRFPQGFDVNIDIQEEDYGRMVLPCSIQLLVENATKHNSISPDKPLNINIVSNGTEISIDNNVIPKLTKSPSTGLGQKYIRQQYLDLSGKEVRIECVNDIYKVTLPLI